MKLLLVAMPDRVYDMDWAAKFPNLGLTSIAGNVEGHHVKILDLILKPNIKFFSTRAVKNVLDDYHPDVVGLSAMTFQYQSAAELAGRIKKWRPDIKVALGGYHATLAFEDIGRSTDAEVFDFLVRGEGELTFNELLGKLEQEEHPDLTGIKGLSYKENGRFYHNPPRENSDLSQIKLPNRTARINNNFHMWGIPSDVVETSRGCTMNCKFCCITKMYGRSYRMYPIDRVIKDIANAKAAGAKYIFFTDDNITLNMKRFERLLDAIIESGHNDIKYSTQASCEGIARSEEIVRKMSKAGFDLIFLGAENVDEENLDYLGKGDILANTLKALRYLDKHNIIATVGIIAGNPDDTPQKIRANVDFFLRKLKCYSYQRFVLTPHLGTKIREELLEQNLVVNKTDFRKYNGFCVNVRTKHLTRRQLEWAIRWEQIKIFPYGILVSKSLIMRKYPWFFFTHLWIAVLIFVVDTVRGLLPTSADMKS
jgi:anaerobic magnesium-protoporphyrin IX monomethyl ester cyclase